MRLAVSAACCAITASLRAVSRSRSRLRLSSCSASPSALVTSDVQPPNGASSTAPNVGNDGRLLAAICLSITANCSGVGSGGHIIAYRYPCG